MTKRGRWLLGAGWALAAGLACSMGCQTYIAGMTLPSPDYLKDKPDYIQKAPQFGLGRELSNMQQGGRNGGTPPVPAAPSVVVPAPAPTPAPSGNPAPPAPGIQ